MAHTPETPKAKSHHTKGTSPSLNPQDKGDQHLISILPSLQSLSIHRERLAQVVTAAPILSNASPPVVSSVLKTCADLADADATLDSRRAAFALWSSASINPRLPESELKGILAVIIRHVSQDCLEDQIRALRKALTSSKVFSIAGNVLVQFLRAELGPAYSHFHNVKRKSRIPRGDSHATSVMPDAEGITLLSSFLLDLVTKSPTPFTGGQHSVLANLLLDLLESVKAIEDVSLVWETFKACLIKANVEELLLERTIQVSCALHEVFESHKDQPQKYEVGEIINILRQKPCVDQIARALYQTIRSPDTKHSRDRRSLRLCGAIGITINLLTNKSKTNQLVTLTDLLIAFQDASFRERRERRICLGALTSLLQYDQFQDSFKNLDWEILATIVARVVQADSVDESAGPRALSRSSSEAALSKLSENVVDHDYFIPSIQLFIQALVPYFLSIHSSQRQSLYVLLQRLEVLVADDPCLLFVSAVQSHFAGMGSGASVHDEVVDAIFTTFLQSNRCSPNVAGLFLRFLQAAVDHRDGEDLWLKGHDYLVDLLKTPSFLSNLKLVNLLARTAVLFWTRQDCSFKIITSDLTYLRAFLKVPDIVSSTRTLQGRNVQETKLANSVSLQLVEAFVHFAAKSSETAVLLYETIVSIANSQSYSRSVRLPAFRVLTRLRCDQAGRVMIITSPDTLGLATALSRTETTIGPQQTEKKVWTRISADDVSGLQRTSAKRSSIGTGHDESSESHVRPSEPIWVYPGHPALPIVPVPRPSEFLQLRIPGQNQLSTIDIKEWLFTLIEILQRPQADWEIYSYIVVHLPSQLSNAALFKHAPALIRMLRNVLTSQLLNKSFISPPQSTNVKPGDIALCLYNSLVVLLGYTSIFTFREQEEIVKAFVAGITGWDRTANCCIQALSICCYHIARPLSRFVINILEIMGRLITQSNLSADILEFLAGLVRFRSIFSNFTEEDFRLVFGICVRFLENSREQRLRVLGGPGVGASQTTRRSSLIPSTADSNTESTVSEDSEREMPQYVFILAYHVITVWFLAVRLSERPKHVGYISSNLAWNDQFGGEIMEEQSKVTLDMMHRTAYNDLNETVPTTIFSEQDGPRILRQWLVGLSIVSFETATRSGLTSVTKRQASGTTNFLYRPHVAELPPHHDSETADIGGGNIPMELAKVFPNHVFLQLSSTIAPTPSPMEPIYLPDDEFVHRAISTFDRSDTVDGYKVGVIYVGDGQQRESEILANEKGSAAFETFLDGLGTKVELRNAQFNAQGLDRSSDEDGSHTYAWRDRVVEIIYHVPTLMPTDAEDKFCVKKKRHIGNNLVNIIFNESGEDIDFETFPSQLNYVNIVITPDGFLRPGMGNVNPVSISDAEREGNEVHETVECLYRIQTLTKPQFPEITPAAMYKILPLASLPAMARQMALFGCTFANIWTNRELGEHVSNWRNRLRSIVRLREKFAGTSSSSSAKFPGKKVSKTYLAGETYTGKYEMGGLIDPEGLGAGLDFSRWAGLGSIA